MAAGSEFGEFADDVDDLIDDIDTVLENAVEETARQLVVEITQQIKSYETDKGGTLDSRTSPYSPGGENDSSDDNYHISEPSAWNSTVRESGEDQYEVVVSPKEAVEDRATYLEGGTSDHGPDGDTPMYFNYNGVTIVVSDVPPVDEDGNPVPISEQFDGNPREVSGIEPVNYFDQAVVNIKSRQVLENNIRIELQKAVTENLET